MEEPHRVQQSLATCARDRKWAGACRCRSERAPHLTPVSLSPPVDREYVRSGDMLLFFSAVKPSLAYVYKATILPSLPSLHFPASLVVPSASGTGRSLAVVEGQTQQCPATERPSNHPDPHLAPYLTSPRKPPISLPLRPVGSSQVDMAPFSARAHQPERSNRRISCCHCHSVNSSTTCCGRAPVQLLTVLTSDQHEPHIHTNLPRVGPLSHGQHPSTTQQQQGTGRLDYCSTTHSPTHSAY